MTPLERKLDILRLYQKGKSNKEISEITGISKAYISGVISGSEARPRYGYLGKDNTNLPIFRNHEKKDNGTRFHMNKKTHYCLTCGVGFETTSPNKKFCDEHSKTVKYRGRG